ncbi:MAG: gamma-glutamylcyclotransferase [Pseudomonadota bacterium]
MRPSNGLRVRDRDRFDAMSGARRDLWIFGYGSLMWRPGFPYLEAVRAVLVGYRRAFCVYSTHHRGTAQRPGLVLGLDQGGVCHGLAFRIAFENNAAVLAYLRAREQINGVYREVLVPLDLHDESGPRGTCDAVTYVVERAHPSYAGQLSVQSQARLIRGAVGRSGPNIDYLANTLRRATSLGLDARDLRRVMTAAHPFFDNARDRSGPWRPPGARSVADAQPDVSAQPDLNAQAEAATDAASSAANPTCPASRTLVSVHRTRKNGPRQLKLGERRRFFFRMNREAWSDLGS